MKNILIIVTKKLSLFFSNKYFITTFSEVKICCTLSYVSQWFVSTTVGNERGSGQPNALVADNFICNIFVSCNSVGLLLDGNV